MGILPAEAFAVRYTVHTLKGYTPFQMVFVRGMTLPIKNTVNWKLIRQRKQAQTNYDNVHKNNNIVDHDFQVGDRFLLINNALYKYDAKYTNVAKMV